MLLTVICITENHNRSYSTLHCLGCRLNFPFYNQQSCTLMGLTQSLNAQTISANRNHQLDQR